MRWLLLLLRHATNGKKICLEGETSLGVFPYQSFAPHNLLKNEEFNIRQVARSFAKKKNKDFWEKQDHNKSFWFLGNCVGWTQLINQVGQFILDIINFFSTPTHPGN